MEDAIRRFAVELGERALAQDWPTVRSMLAPWLRATMTDDDVRAFFEDEYRASLEANEIDGMHYPDYPEPEVGGTRTDTPCTRRSDRREHEVLGKSATSVLRRADGRVGY